MRINYDEKHETTLIGASTLYEGGNPLGELGA
jgi:hypothetical protein